MPVNLYSSATVDSLLSAKLTDAASNGYSYARKDSTWETVPNHGDSFSIGKVQEVIASGGYWLITFAPVNATLMGLGLSVSLSDGTSSEAITSYSQSSTWTYTTTTISDANYLFVTFNGQRSNLSISTP
jgi:hypothetical protein